MTPPYKLRGAEFREYLNANPEALEAQREYSRRNGAIQYAKRREWLVEYKLSRGCIDCGYNANADALDLDHRDGEVRVFTGFSNNLRRRWEVVLAEVAKCDVRCRNCHAIKTCAAMRRRVAEGGGGIGAPRRTGPRFAKDS